jgi:hypothetical protein
MREREGVRERERESFPYTKQQLHWTQEGKTEGESAPHRH